jgi:hypothetical protein
MPETIRQHLKRRARLSLLIIGVGMLLMLVLTPLMHYGTWAGCLVIGIFVAMAVGSIASCAGMRCPNCGRWYSRGDYARFTWFFLSEPDVCPRCGESYDAPWRKWSKP